LGIGPAFGAYSQFTAAAAGSALCTNLLLFVTAASAVAVAIAIAIAVVAMG
jgi:hypothetical protein